MKKTFAVMAALLGMALPAQDALEQLKIPEGENLLANPTFQENPDKPRQPLKWGGRKDIKFSWIEENGRKILRAETSTPGYHLGINQQVRNLKSNTEYLLYLAARGKISDGSVRILYHEGKIPGQKKAVFARGGGGMKKDFSWQLFQVKFRTPADFKDGVCSLYAVLFYGSTQIDIVQAGLVECKPKKLFPPPKGAANLLNNPELKTSSQTPGFPYDWNMDFAEKIKSFRYEQDRDGSGIVTLLPPIKGKLANWGEDQVGLKQSGLRLNPGKKYRFGALIRTKNLKAQRAGLVVYNYAWTQSCEIPLPGNTNGWERVEGDAVLPKSRGEEYAFAAFTVGCTAGEVSIKSPYLIPMDEAAAGGVEKAPAIHSLRQIVPVAPLLAKMSAEKPDMIFAFRSVLPKPETGYECHVRIKSLDAGKVLAQGVFPLKDNHIHAVFRKLPPGKIVIETVLIDKQTGKTFASRIERENNDPRNTCQEPSTLLSVRIRSIRKPDDNITVQPVPGYNSWPFIQTLGNKLVCVYSRGSAHTIEESTRGVFARTSKDGGKSWMKEVLISNEPDGGEVTIGKGVDSHGAMLVWVRCAGIKAILHHDLYRTEDGVKFYRISRLKPDPMPIQITDIFAVPGVGLMSLWFAGSHGNTSNNSWGTLVSTDDGITWKQTVIESGLNKQEWPTEQSAVYLGGGKILAIARVEGGDKNSCRALFQLKSEDFGKTWERTLTNITDVLESTPSLILDRNKLFLYYFQRVTGQLKCRISDPGFIWKNPLCWPAPDVVALGSRKWCHAGNVNSVVCGDNHCLTFYSGDEKNTAVVVKIVSVKP